MIKKIPIIIFILSFSISFSQFYEYENCGEAKKSAKKDFKNGNSSFRIYGLLDDTETDFEFENFYNVLLYSKYSIKVEYMGCLTSENAICYVKKMNSLIKKKYGENFFKKTRIELENIYNETSEKEKSKLLDLSKVYDFELDSYPKFIGNDKELSFFIKKMIPKLILIINEKGKVEDLENDNNEKKILNKQKIISKINAFGSFVPAYLYGIKVKSIYIQNTDY